MLTDADRWYPVSPGAEVPPRHIVQTQLLSQELAVWRDDAGALNAWANRCPHRGVRLSLGFHLGSELRCQYHAWRFASRSGQCTFIPAHPSQRPAAGIRAEVFPVAERHGYVWVSLAPRDAAPSLPIAAGMTTTVLRSLFIAAPAAALAAQLQRGYPLETGDADPVTPLDAYTYCVPEISPRARGGGDAPAQLLFMIQPVTATESVLHATLFGAPAAAPTAPDRFATLRAHHGRMRVLRTALESRESPATRRSAP